MLSSKRFLATMALSGPTLALVTPPKGYRQVGGTLTQEHALEFGDLVEISDDGKTMVAASDISITAYTLHGAPEHPDSTWQTIKQVPFDGLSDVQALSLSPDGSFLAARWGSMVQIYSLIDNPTNTPPFALTGVCDDGHKIHLGQTKTSTHVNQWLLVSCDRYDHDRGKVEIYRRVSDKWLLITAIEGSYPSARFGYSTALYGGKGYPMIAIASPQYNFNRGLVQLYDLPLTGGFYKRGKELMGKEMGDKFGWDLAVSTNRSLRMVVGAPDCNNDRGCVSVFGWKPTNVFAIEYEWEPIGEVVSGERTGDRFGSAVAMAGNGYRWAAASVSSKSDTGMVRLYDSDPKLTLVQTFVGGDPGKQWGNSVSLNGSGSMVVSGTVLSKSVQVFLEYTPNTESPSSSPSAAPSTSPSLAPTVSPSVPPSTAPSQVPSGSPSAMPSTAPSLAPTEFSSPTMVPSLLPTSAPQSPEKGINLLALSAVLACIFIVAAVVKKRWRGKTKVSSDEGEEGETKANSQSLEGVADSV